MKHFSVLIILTLLSNVCVNAQSYLPLSGGTLTGNLTVSGSTNQIQAPYYGFNAPYVQPSTSNNVAIFANGTVNYLDIVGFVNGWRLIPGSPSTYHIPVVTFNTSGATVLGDNTTGLPPGGNALTLRGPNTPAGSTGYQDINFSFISAGSARIRSYRGGSMDTYLQFLVNKVGQIGDAPTVAMHIDQTGNVGIGTTNPTNNKLQIADGADDVTGYGAVQIIRPASTASDYKYHIAFVRQGQMFSGIGYAYNTNTLGIFAGNNTSQTPVIAVLQNQSVGIGTLNPGTFKLAVEGSLGARKVVVTQTSPWPDYVFDSGYKLRSLDETEAFVKMNKHLPDVPTAKEIQSTGNDLGDNQTKLLQKIEELTLYMIAQNKEIGNLKKEITQLKQDIKKP